MLAIAVAALSIATAQVLPSFEPAIFSTLNQLRTNPAGYAEVLRQQRRFYHGNLLEIPGRPYLQTQEGIHPLDEAIAALGLMHSDLGRVALSAGLSRAAADHVLDMGRHGLTGHTGTDSSSVTRRIERYGTWSGMVGEDIAYGEHDAGSIVGVLLIDDGVTDRAHRRSLLDPRWRYVGIACGAHLRYRTICVLDFASSYRAR